MVSKITARRIGRKNWKTEDDETFSLQTMGIIIGMLLEYYYYLSEQHRA